MALIIYREFLMVDQNKGMSYSDAGVNIKAGNELTANYNLYTYPKTGVGLQMI